MNKSRQATQSRASLAIPLADYSIAKHAFPSPDCSGILRAGFGTAEGLVCLYKTGATERVYAFRAEIERKAEPNIRK